MYYHIYPPGFVDIPAFADNNPYKVKECWQTGGALSFAIERLLTVLSFEEKKENQTDCHECTVKQYVHLS